MFCSTNVLRFAFSFELCSNLGTSKERILITAHIDFSDEAKTFA